MIRLSNSLSWNGKDLKPTLNITGTSVEFDYTVSPQQMVLEGFYDYLKQKMHQDDSNEEEYIKNQFIKLSVNLQDGAKDLPIQLMNLIEVMLKIHSVSKER